MQERARASLPYALASLKKAHEHGRENQKVGKLVILCRETELRRRPSKNTIIETRTIDEMEEHVRAERVHQR